MSFIDQYNSAADVGQAVNPSGPKYTKAPPPKRGLIGTISHALNEDVLQPALRTGQNLTKIQNNSIQQYKKSGGKNIAAAVGFGSEGLNGVDKAQAAKDFISTGINFSPLVAAKGASVAGKVYQGAKIGAGAGAAQGAASQIGSNNPEDYISGGIQGGLAGGAAGAGLGLLGGVAGKIGAKTAVAPTVTGKPSGVLGKLGEHMETQGQQMRGRSGGHGIGAKLPGSGALGFQASSDITNILDKEGIKPGSPIGMQRSAEEKLGQYGSQIDHTLTDANRPLSVAEKAKIKSDILGSVENGSVDDTIRGHAQEFAKNFDNQVTDLKSLVKFRRDLDKNSINYIANPDSATAAKQQAATAVRQTVSDHTGEMAPGLKELNSNYHDLHTANEHLIQGARAINNASGGVIGRVVNSGPVQSAEAKVGAVLQKAGGKPSTVLKAPEATPEAQSSFSDTLQQHTGTATPESLFKVPQPGAIGDRIEQGALQGVGKATGLLARNAYRSRVPGGITGSNSATQTPSSDEPTSDVVQTDTVAPESSPDTGSMYSQANMMSDIQRDPKNMSAYLSLYKELNPAQKAPKTKTEAELAREEALGISQDALSALKGGGVGTGAINPRIQEGLANLGLGGDEKTITFDKQISALRAAIAKARAGTAMSPGEEKLLNQYTPQVGDSHQQLESKLNYIQQVFGRSTANYSGASSADLLTPSNY